MAKSDVLRACIEAHRVARPWRAAHAFVRKLNSLLWPAGSVIGSCGIALEPCIANVPRHAGGVLAAGEKVFCHTLVRVPKAQQLI